MNKPQTEAGIRAAKRILVVEDDLLTATALESGLLKLGYEVPAVVDTGEEAVRKAAELRPDLILMDIILAGPMRGIEAAAEIKDSLDIPIVYLTAHTDVETMVQAKTSEPFGYLPKPCSTATLLATVEMALYKSEVDAARKSTEAQLVRLNQHQELILSSVIEGILGLDVHGNHTFVNPAAAKMLGYSQKELLGRPSHRTWHHTKADGAPYPEEECLIHATLRDGVVHRGSTEVFWRKDGTSFPVEYSATPLQDQGRVIGTVVTFTDISARKKAEAEAKRHELRLKRLVDILQHPSKTIKEFLDYALDQALQLTESKIGYIYHYHEDRKEFVLNTWSKDVMAECAVDKPPTCYELDKTGIWGEAVRQHRPIIINDYLADNPLKKGYPAGHVTLLKFMTVPITKDGSIVGVVGLANKETDYDETDILQVSLLMEAVWKVTERKEAEETLKTSEAKYRSLFNNSEIAMFRTRLDGSETLDVNQRFLDLVGKTREEVLGRPSSILWEDPTERERLVRILVADGSASEFEFNMLNEKKGLRHCVMSLLLYREQGILEGTIADITERKQAEMAKEKIQAQLNQAQKMESIGILAGGIAHDFNNILGVILGYTELAKEDAPPGSLFASDLDKVLTASHRAKGLIKQILDFSRQTGADYLPITIQPLVKESLKLLRASLPSTITIHEDINQQCGSVLADPTQVHQVIMNLCTNAYHAMEKTGGVLSVTMQPTLIEPHAPSAEVQGLTPGEYVELTVSDTGTGIGPDIIGKIFDPFFTTKEIGKGTGMGLSILHGIIKAYGGAITVESALGQGTTFHVYFPVVDKEATKIEKPLKAPKGKGRILLIDDEALLLDVGKDMLTHLGYTVTTRSTSLEALETFVDGPDQFDLVITDQTMPAMTGTDLARRMLQIRPDLPIILCTGFSNLINEESAKAIGIREFAMKPLTIASTGHLLKKLLNGDHLPQ